MMYDTYWGLHYWLLAWIFLFAILYFLLLWYPSELLNSRVDYVRLILVIVLLIADRTVSLVDKLQDCYILVAVLLIAYAYAVCYTISLLAMISVRIVNSRIDHVWHILVTVLLFACIHMYIAVCYTVSPVAMISVRVVKLQDWPWCMTHIGDCTIDCLHIYRYLYLLYYTF